MEFKYHNISGIILKYVLRCNINLPLQMDKVQGFGACYFVTLELELKAWLST